MRLVDDVLPVNTIVQIVLNCLDIAVEMMMEWTEPMAVDCLLSVEFDPLINPMTHKGLHPTMSDQFLDSNVLNTVRPRHHILLKQIHEVYLTFSE